MKAHKYEDGMKDDIRLALLEQSIGHINETLGRIEKRLDKIEDKIDRFDSRIWMNFYWILGTMFSLSCIMGGLLAKGFGWLE